MYKFTLVYSLRVEKESIMKAYYYRLCLEFDISKKIKAHKFELIHNYASFLYKYLKYLKFAQP